MRHCITSSPQLVLAETPGSAFVFKTFILFIKSRKFFCTHLSCEQKIFTERPPDWYESYARQTSRLHNFLRHLAFSLSAEAASRLSISFGIPTSADTFLRIVRKEVIPIPTDFSIIGIDDWALKKGHRYGSIICDLTTRKPVALLESRRVEDVKEWLRHYPEVRAVSHDGSLEYAKAITEGTTNAIQITDRWHLFYNLSRKIDQFLKKTFNKTITVMVTEKPNEETSGSNSQTKSEKKKWKLVQELKKSYHEGIQISTLSRMYGLDRKTVRKYLLLDKPMRHERKSHHSADLYRELILELMEKPLSAPLIYNIFRKGGYTKSLSTLRDYMLHLKKKNDRDIPIYKRLARNRVYEYIWGKERASPDETKLINQLIQKHPWLREVRSLLLAFQQVMKDRKYLSHLKDWVTAAANSSISEFQQFSAYLKSDWEDVQNAYLSKWSNGPVEGQVTRIKLIKRQMYGRANYDLIRQKVLSTFS